MFLTILCIFYVALYFLIGFTVGIVSSAMQRADGVDAGFIVFLFFWCWPVPVSMWFSGKLVELVQE